MVAATEHAALGSAAKPWSWRHFCPLADLDTALSTRAARAFSVSSSDAAWWMRCSVRFHTAGSRR
eukprot:1840631-Prymnesium_polylepis.1